MDNKIVGLNVKKYRRAACLTQEKLAEMLNISTVHMSHIECGHVSMSIEILISLCEILKVTPNHILNGVFVEYHEASSDSIMSGIPEKRCLLAHKILEVLRDCP